MAAEWAEAGIDVSAFEKKPILWQHEIWLLNCYALCSRPASFTGIPVPVDNLSASIIYDRMNLAAHLSFRQWLLLVDQLDATTIEFRIEENKKKKAEPEPEKLVT